MMLVSVSTICAERELNIMHDEATVQQCIAAGVGLVMFSAALGVFFTFGFVPNLLRKGAAFRQVETQEVLAVDS